MKRNLTRHQRHGVTLIEMLIVIAIMGILAAILLPTLGAIRKASQEAGMALEIKGLAEAIEEYKTTYGDYPPDGSNIVVFQRHIQVAFPRIAPAELTNLINLIDLKDGNGNSTGRTIIDPAEALVFFLGGFSDDPRFPFTGEGGPLSPVRRNALFDFAAGKLTQSTTTINLGTPANPILIPLSSDEENLFGQPPSNNDIFPAYIPSASDTPFVYLDHRTYMPRPIYSFNQRLVPPAQYPPVGSSFAQGGMNSGYVRAYRSDQQRQSTAEDVFPYRWHGERTFQLICAGTDNNLGDPLPLLDSNGNPQYKQYPSNKLFSEGDESNITSFSQSTLEGGQ